MNAETFDTVIKIVAIIQIALVIMFVILVINVGKIKKQLERKNSYEEYIRLADMETYVGNKTKARDFYLRAKYIIENELSYMYIDSESVKKVKIKIEEKLKEL